MWFQVYKVSVKSLSRKISGFDRNVIIGLFVLMLMIQMSIYFQFSKSLDLINPYELNIIIEAFFNILGLGAAIGTFLFLYINKEQNLRSLLHLPISNSSINRAQYLPIILAIILFVIFETSGALYSIFYLFEDSFIYLRLILAFLIYISIFVSTSFFVKKVCEVLFLQKRYGYLFEIIFVCIYVICQIALLTVENKYLNDFTIVNLVTGFVFDNNLYNMLGLIIILISTYLLIELLIFRTSPYYFTFNKLGKTFNLNIFKLLKLNGISLSIVHLFRNIHLLRSFSFSIIIGILLTLFSLQFFHSDNLLQHYQFLVLCLGSHLSGIVLYDNATTKALKNLHINYMKILWQKVLFVFLLMIITFNLCISLLTLLNFTNEQLSFMGIISLNAQLLFYAAIMLVLSFLLNKFIDNSKIFLGIVGLIIYLAAVEVINSLSPTGYLSTILLTLFTVLFTFIFIIGYSKRLLGAVK
ncbi:hypothetical protein ASG65_12135 [Bacillus sp. Leaf13]|nr:hypothetical protein ASG65_12135 [Bacillus sp. Leaf13]